MTTIETKIAKNGVEMYYRVDENGKLRRISASEASAIETSNLVESLGEHKGEAYNVNEIVCTLDVTLHQEITTAILPEYTATKFFTNVNDAVKAARAIANNDKFIRAYINNFGDNKRLFTVKADKTEEFTEAYVETANVEVKAATATAETVEVNVEKAIFAVGKVYVSDWETEYKVIKRTAKTVTIVPAIYADDYEDISENPFVKTRRVKSDNNGEFLSFMEDEGAAITCGGRVEVNVRANAEFKTEIERLQEKREDISGQLVKLDAAKHLLTASEFDAKAGELKSNLHYVNLQIDAINVGDNFDYVNASEHIWCVYHDLDNFIRYHKGENGLTQEQCENIYATVYSQCEFGFADFDLIDRLVEECKRENNQPDPEPKSPAPAVLTPAQIAAAEIVNSLGNVIVKFAYAGEGKNGGLALHYETFNSVGDEFPTDVSIVEVFKPKSYILDHVNVIKGYGDNKQIVQHFFKDYTVMNTPATGAELKTPAPNSPYAIANNLTGILQTATGGVGYMDFTTQGGAREVAYPGNLYVEPDRNTNDVNGYVFANGYAAFARYETPEQVIDVMTALRDAIKAGKTEFTFPAGNDNEPPAPPVDEFTAKLAALDADVTRAEADRDAAKAAYDKACDAADTASAARQAYLDSIAGNLTNKLHDECRDNDFIETATASGCPYTIGDFDNIYVDATTDGKFKFVTCNNRELARYDTPAQVETVIARLKDAIARHEPAFYFPTVDELNAPPATPATPAQNTPPFNLTPLTTQSSLFDSTPPAPPTTPVEPAPVDVKITFDRILKARRHGINHITTKQGRHMWYICGRLANKKEITEWLADEGFTVDEYIAAEKVADKYENEVEFPRRMAIYAQAEFLWDKIAADKQASVEPLPALFPADDSDDDEPVDLPVEPVISKEQLIDSLTRAMQTAMEKFQGFCRVKNLTAANNEMKLYNICREATRELWKEGLK